MILWSFSLCGDGSSQLGEIELKIATESGVSCCAFICDKAEERMGPAEQCVAGGFHGDLVVWSLRNGMKLQQLFGHNTHLLSCSLTRSVDGIRNLSSASADGDIRVWCLDQSECVTLSAGALNNSAAGQDHADEWQLAFNDDADSFFPPELQNDLQKARNVLDKASITEYMTLAIPTECVLGVMIGAAIAISVTDAAAEAQFWRVQAGERQAARYR